jgi:biofilm regulator BssS
MTSTHDDYHGALVGWTSQNLGGRLVLRLQSVTKPAPHSQDDVHSFYFVMDENQAVQLGNYLFELTGQTAPRKRKRSWFDRLLDG